MFKITQQMPELTGRKYDAFKKTMKAVAKEKEELDSIRRTISNLPSEGPKTGTWGISSRRGGRSRRRKSRKKRRKRKTKRKKTRKKRRKSRRKRRR